jgi:hypothetical protein
VLVYDADKLTGGTLPDRDEVKADAQFVPPGGRAWLAGLAAARGKGLVLTMTPPENNRGFKGRLHQFDPMSGRLSQSMDLPDPAWRLAVSRDGSKAYTGSVVLQNASVPLPTPSDGGYVTVIDVAGWKKERSVSLPGMAFDLSVTADGRGLAVLASGRVFALPAGAGDSVELGTLPPVPTANSSEYGAVSPDGTKLVASRYGGFGIRVLSITKWDGPGNVALTAGYERLQLAGRDGADPVGGYFHLTPDGRFALFRTGHVFALEP